MADIREVAYVRVTVEDKTHSAKSSLYIDIELVPQEARAALIQEFIRRYNPDALTGEMDR